MHHRPTKLAEQPIFERSIFRGSMNFYSLLSTMPWLNITNCTVYWCILMSVMIVGDEVLFWWNYLQTLDYLLYIFVLRSFYCIFKIVCPCTALYLFLAFWLQVLNKHELSLKCKQKNSCRGLLVKKQYLAYGHTTGKNGATVWHRMCRFKSSSNHSPGQPQVPGASWVGWLVNDKPK